MGDNLKEDAGKKAVGNLFTGGAVGLGTGSEAITRKIAVSSGAYTTTADKKQAITEQKQAEDAEIAESERQATLQEEDIRRRTAIFQSMGGSVSVGGRSTIYGN